MRTITTIFVSLTCVAVASGCSSSSSSDSPGTDAGKDTAVGGGDTSVLTDTATTGDTAKPGDAKTDTKTGGDSIATDTSVPPDCDPVKQTGCTGAKSKCTALDDGTGGVSAGCIAPSGTGATDATCARKSEDPAGIGDDNCAPGNYCSGIGTLMTPPSRHCRKFCLADTECGTGQKCSQLISDGMGGGLYGICVPTCTLFGTDCPTGLNCSILIADMDAKSLYGTCRAVGTGAAASACKAGTECAKDLVCADPTMSGADTCIPLCDTAHACTGTATCKAQPGLPLSGGLCQ